ncbi:hypothetical protein BHM03_00000955 [Ensete ventricosum]|nr:hypothetical protein BHM03_00000955 [Ensete ventricosum]
MDRMRAGSPAYSRQGSGGSSGSGSSSPGMSPGHHRSASASGISGIRRTQNLAAKAANARLAQVMASQASAEEEEDDLLPARAGSGFVGGVRFGLPRPVPNSNGGGGASLFGRSARSPSPAVIARLNTSARTRQGRFFPDMGHLNFREPGDLREASALQDQVANLGEGVSLEARHLSRKEAALRQREIPGTILYRDKLGMPVRTDTANLAQEAMKAAMRTKDDKGEELTALRQEVQSAKDEIANTMDQLKDAELEVKSLRSMTHRMILTQEEMEEVVLKRCWLARYWALAVRHGKFVEDAVMLVLAQQRRPNLLRQSGSDLRSPGDPKWDEFELSQEEAEDVLFKQVLLLAP